MAKIRTSFAVLLFALTAPAFADTVDTHLPICPTFDQFPVNEKFSGPYKQPNLHQSKETWQFRTQLRNVSKRDPTYAGYFNIAEWGCGTSCDAFAAINRRTGMVVIPDISAAYGLEYHLDSRLILVDSTRLIEKLFSDQPDSMPQEGNFTPDTYTTQYIIYDEDKVAFSKPIVCHQDLSKD